MNSLNNRLTRLEVVASPKQFCQCDWWAFDSQAAYQMAIESLTGAGQPGNCPKCGKPSGALPVKVYIGVDYERV